VTGKISGITEERTGTIGRKMARKKRKKGEGFRYKKFLQTECLQ
jgi:hypothetical protein